MNLHCNNLQWPNFNELTLGKWQYNFTHQPIPSRDDKSRLSKNTSQLHNLSPPTIFSIQQILSFDYWDLFLARHCTQSLQSSWIKQRVGSQPRIEGDGVDLYRFSPCEEKWILQWRSLYQMINKIAAQKFNVKGLGLCAHNNSECSHTLDANPIAPRFICKHTLSWRQIQ